MTQRIEYIEKLISDIKNAEISVYRDNAYWRAKATIDAFKDFNDIGLGDSKRLYEDARTAYKE